MAAILSELGIRRAATAPVHTAGAVVCSAFGVLAITSYFPPLPWWCYLSVMAVAWTAVVWAWRCDTATVRAVVGWAIVMRVIAACSQPIYEDDVWRYLWDGWRVASSGAPYGITPSKWFGDLTVPANGQLALDRINHPDLPTIYGPVCQAVFGLAHVIDPWRLWPLKLLIGAGEVALLTWLALRHPGRHLLPYAWCPLVLQEVWCSTHVDALALFPAIVGVDLVLRGRPRVGGLLLGLALATRLSVLPAVLVVVAVDLSSALWIAIAAALCYAPFALVGGSLGIESTRLMVQDWRFNDLGNALLNWLLGSWGRVVASGIAGLGLLMLAWRMRFSQVRPLWLTNPEYLVAVAMAWALLWSPVINPWYLLWLVPALVVRPSAWILGALLAMPLCYLTGHVLGIEQLWTYDHPWWVRLLEIMLIGGGCLLSGWRWYHHRMGVARSSSLLSPPVPGQLPRERPSQDGS
jgi:alpha-1,6-mannosyltransferase